MCFNALVLYACALLEQAINHHSQPLIDCSFFGRSRFNSLSHTQTSKINVYHLD